MTLPSDWTRFVMLMLGRSGSSHLTALLDSHPHVRARGEKPGSMKLTKQMSWSRRFYETPPDAGVRVIGFKIKRKDLKDPDAFADLLRELEVRVIMLRRRNLVKMTVSWLNSERLFNETGQWNLSSDAERLPPLVVDPDRFDRRLGLIAKARDALEAYVDGLGLPTTGVYYEELLADERGTLARLFDFLGVEPADTRSPFKKNTSDDLATAIANFHELRGRYLGTHLLPFFDEVILRDGGVEAENR